MRTKLLLTLAFAITFFTSYASHFMGADLTYECLNGCTYRIYSSVYLDCDGSATSSYLPPTNANPYPQPSLNFVGSPANCTFSGGTTWTLVSFSEVTPLCPSAVASGTQCTNPNAAINGVAGAVYYTDVNLCNTNCTTFCFDWSNCCRNYAITSGADGAGIFNGPVCIDLTLSPCNSSPVFSNVPTPYICAGQYYSFNQGATDPDGDSLSYALGPCYSGNGVSVPYTAAGGYSPTSPLGSTWNVTVDPITGDVAFNPNPGGTVIGVMCIVVTEWRNGVQIGQITRDIQITVINGNCVSNPPASPITGLTVGGVNVPPFDPNTGFGCVNVPLCFDLPIDTTGIGGGIFTMYWTPGPNMPANAVFYDASNPANQDTVENMAPTAHFCFTPPGAGTYTFVVTVKDDHCPIPGSVQFTITLVITQGMTNTTATANYNNCNEVIFTAYPDPTSLNPTYNWTGNGNVSSSPNATDSTFMHLYPAPGTYPWQVVIQDTFGCVNTVTGTINIPTGATADAGSDISMCSGYQFQLGSTSIPGQTYSWSPGTGLSSISTSNPMVSMVNPGPNPITVNYTVSSTLGLCSTVDFVTAIVYPTPAVDITPNNPVICGGDSVTLTASGGANYLWSTGDVSNSITVAPNTNTTYSVVSFVDGCSSLPTFETVTVTYGPIGQISGMMGVCTGTNTTLTASGGTSFVWNNGLANPSITLSNIQNDTTVYMIPSSGSCPGDTIFATVAAFANPTANFTATTACAGTPTVFTDLSVLSAGAIIAWSWNFGDPTSVENVSNQTSPNHVYAQSGSYNVSLSVTSNNGCVHTFTAPITVTAVPVVDFGFANVCEGIAANFTNQTTIANGGTITSYNWDFGDASQGTLQNENHVYATYGQFNVTLSAVSNNGCTDSYTQTVIIHPKPDANFTTKAVCKVDAMPFISTATVEGNLDYIINPNWTFGDPASGTSNNASGYSPSHTFTAPGNYNVTQIVTTNNGCKDTVTLPVLVFPQPVAAFTVVNRCENEVAQFSDLSTVGAATPVTAWYWNFGVGNVASNEQNPVFDYEPRGAGTYSITLLVSTSEGCKDTLVENIIINPIANPSFTNNEPCLGDKMFLTNTTEITTGGVDETNGYTWLFNEQPPITSTVKNPEFLYTSAGNHTVTLTAVSDSGCVNSVTQTVRVNALPNLPEIHQDTVCVGDKAVFSIDPASVGDVVRWYTSPTSLEPFYTGNSYISPELSTSQTYYIQLTTGQGCKSTFYPVTGTVHLPEDVQMIVSNTQVEMPSLPISFGTQSTIPLATWNWNFADETTSQSPTPIHEYKAPGRYSVLLTTVDENGCIFTLSKNIEVRRVVTVSVPTAFSPNDDGTNDYFYIGSYNLSAFYIGVYNRWGTLVYESNDPGFRWDGKDINGKIIPEGVYVYVVKATTFDGVKEDRTGTITVAR